MPASGYVAMVSPMLSESCLYILSCPDIKMKPIIPAVFRGKYIVMLRIHIIVAFCDELIFLF